MSRYYISVDLEGVCGVTSLFQCTDRKGYESAVRQLVLEINTVVDAIFAADSEADILINDAHNSMTNLSLDMLAPQIRLLSGKPKPFSMMAGLDESFDAVFFIGYHAKAGAEKSVLSHTFHSKIFDIQINEVSYGEGGINALYASLVHNVPVVLASGDRAFCQEIKQQIPRIQTIETKVGLSTTSARSHAQTAVLEFYHQQTVKILKESTRWSLSILSLEGPYNLQITFTNTLACDAVSIIPSFNRIDGRTVEMSNNKFPKIYNAIQSAYMMLAYTDNLE